MIKQCHCYLYTFLKSISSKICIHVHVIGLHDCTDAMTSIMTDNSVFVYRCIYD